MKILIFYTPRSKSTLLQEIMSKKYNLTALVDPFVFSKMKNQNTEEFPRIINHINSSQNICVKVSSTDFLDSRNRKILDYYKDIDYKSFDKIIFVTRKDVQAASLSFCHMNLKEPNSWHSTKDHQTIGRSFNPDIDRILYLLRSYRLFEFVKKYIINDHQNICYDYEYNTLEESLKSNFSLSDRDFDTKLTANDIDYQKLVFNYDGVCAAIKINYSEISNASDYDLQTSNSKFWTVRFES
jgi:hypothetical protein